MAVAAVVAPTALTYVCIKWILHSLSVASFETNPNQSEQVTKIKCLSIETCEPSIV